MNTTLRDATAAELRLLLTVIERQGKAWTQEMPPEAAKEAAIQVRFDPNVWKRLVFKYKDEAVDTVADLAHLKLIVSRLVSRLTVDPDRPPNLTLAKKRSALNWQETDLET